MFPPSCGHPTPSAVAAARPCGDAASRCTAMAAGVRRTASSTVGATTTQPGTSGTRTVAVPPASTAMAMAYSKLNRSRIALPLPEPRHAGPRGLPYGPGCCTAYQTSESRVSTMREFPPLPRASVTPLAATGVRAQSGATIREATAHGPTPLTTPLSAMSCMYFSRLPSIARTIALMMSRVSMSRRLCLPANSLTYRSSGNPG